MTEVTRAEMEDRARERAQIHAESLAGVSNDPERPIRQAQSVVARIFDAMGVGHHVNPAPLTTWTHRREKQQYEDDWRTLIIRRLDLIAAAERYLEFPWLSSREMDWVVVNMLVYAEVQGYQDYLTKKRMSGLRYAVEKDRDLTLKRWFAAGAVAWFLAKWAVWLALFAASSSDGFRIGLVAITAAWQGWRWWHRRKENRIFAAMVNAYSHLNTVSVSWRVVWEELSRARAAGVVWDGVVYRLVELRLGHGTPASEAAHSSD